MEDTKRFLLNGLMQAILDSGRFHALSEHDWSNIVEHSRDVEFAYNLTQNDLYGEPAILAKFPQVHLGSVACCVEWREKAGLKQSSYYGPDNHPAIILACRTALGITDSTMMDVLPCDPNKTILDAYAAITKRSHKTAALYHELGERLASRISTGRMWRNGFKFSDYTRFAQDYHVDGCGTILRIATWRSTKGKTVVPHQDKHCSDERAVKCSPKDALHDPIFLAAVERAKHGLLGRQDDESIGPAKQPAHADPPKRKTVRLPKDVAERILESKSVIVDTDRTINKVAETMVRASKTNPVRLIQDDKYGCWLELTVKTKNALAGVYTLWLEKDQGAEILKSFYFRGTHDAKRADMCLNDTTRLIRALVVYGCNLALRNTTKVKPSKSSRERTKLLAAVKTLKTASEKYAALVAEVRKIANRMHKKEIAEAAADVDALLLSTSIRKAMGNARIKYAVVLAKTLSETIAQHQAKPRNRRTHAA